MNQMERKTHVSRNKGQSKEERQGRQTRDTKPRQQHILRMLHVVATEWFFTAVMWVCLPAFRTVWWVSLDTSGTTGMALIAWGLWGCRTTLLSNLGTGIQPPAGRQTHSYPQSGAGSSGCKAKAGRQSPGAPAQRAELTALEMMLPPLNIWYKGSPRIDHFLLPPQRKQHWKKAQSRPGWCKEGSLLQAASPWERDVHPRVQLWDKLSAPGRTQGVWPVKHPNANIGAVPPPTETHQHFAIKPKPKPSHPQNLLLKLLLCQRAQAVINPHLHFQRWIYNAALVHGIFLVGRRPSVGKCVNKTKTSVSANADKSDNET
ncbi:uncharacterized protein ACIB01_004413 isoform 1-T5 [Guaruba guarouba]